MPRRSARAVLITACLLIQACGCTALWQPQSKALAEKRRADRIVAMAQQHERQGNPEFAQRLYGNVLSAQPSHADARRRMEALASKSTHTRTGSNDALASAGGKRPSAPEHTVVAEPPRAEEHRLAATDVVGRSSIQADAERPTRIAIVPAPREFLHNDGDQFLSIADFESAMTDDASSWSATQQRHVSETTPADWELPAWSLGGDKDDIPSSTVEWTRSSLARGRPPVDEELQPLIAQLESRQSDLRKSALIELAGRGPDAGRSLAAVRSLMTERNPMIQAHAAWAIWKITDDAETSVPTLVALLASQDDDVVQLAAYTLGTMEARASSSVVPLRRLRDNAPAGTRILAAEALVRIDPDDQHSLTVLTSALRQDDDQVRGLAAIALGAVSHNHSPGVVAALSAALEDRTPWVCSAAALSLGAFGDAGRPAVPVLHRLAQHQVEDVRNAARTALACIER